MNKLLVLILTFLASQTWAASSAAGLFWGDPNSLTFKYIESTNTAYNFGLSFSSNYGFYAIGEYQKAFPGSMRTREAFTAKITPYVGVGAFVVNTKASTNSKGVVTKDSKTWLGVRVPLGLEWMGWLPVSVYLEIAPGMAIAPDTTSFFGSGLGIRYYF